MSDDRAGVDPRTLKPGQRVRVTFEGSVSGRPTETHWWAMVDGGTGATPFKYDERVTVEVLPDPLPTEVGAHIVATVTRGEETVRTSLCRWSEAFWRSAAVVAGASLHTDEHLSHWAPLNLDAPGGAS